MRNLSIVLLILALQAFANASSETSQVIAPISPTLGIANIKKGNMEIGGSISVSKPNKESYTYYYLSPSAEYFLMDNFSLGGTISLAGSSGSSSDYSSYGIGPSASYYFYQQGTTAFFVSQSVNFARATNDGRTDDLNIGTTSVGLKLFLVPQVAFGFALSTNYGLGSTKEEQYQSTTWLNGSFSFYY